MKLNRTILPRIVRVRPNQKNIRIDLDNGSRVVVPTDCHPELSAMNSKQIRNVKLVRDSTHLLWPEEELVFSPSDLVQIAQIKSIHDKSTDEAIAEKRAARQRRGDKKA